MRPELPAASQSFQVLHVSEQEEDVLAFGMRLKQPVTKTTTVHAAIREPLSAVHEELPVIFIPTLKQTSPWVSPLKGHEIKEFLARTVTKPYSQRRV